MISNNVAWVYWTFHRSAAGLKDGAGAVIKKIVTCEHVPVCHVGKKEAR